APGRRRQPAAAARRRSTPGSARARPRRSGGAARGPAACGRRSRRTAAGPRCRDRPPCSPPTTFILRALPYGKISANRARRRPARTHPLRALPQGVHCRRALQTRRDGVKRTVFETALIMAVLVLGLEVIHYRNAVLEANVDRKRA